MEGGSLPFLITGIQRKKEKRREQGEERVRNGSRIVVYIVRVRPSVEASKRVESRKSERERVLGVCERTAICVTETKPTECEEGEKVSRLVGKARRERRRRGRREREKGRRKVGNAESTGGWKRSKTQRKARRKGDESSKRKGAENAWRRVYYFFDDSRAALMSGESVRSGSDFLKKGCCKETREQRTSWSASLLVLEAGEASVERG